MPSWGLGLVVWWAEIGLPPAIISDTELAMTIDDSRWMTSMAQCANLRAVRTTRTGLRMGGEDRQMTLRVRDTTMNLSADANSCPISKAYMRIRRPDIDMNEQRFGEKRNESFTETRSREIRRSISFGTRIQFDSEFFWQQAP